jgi:hypothetical protein
MPFIDAQTFAQTWLDAWNAHDIDAVLTHFADDADFSSPLARQLLEGSDGVLHGKAAIRGYWEEGLRRIPGLHFELVDVYSGTDIIVINYRNQRGGLVNEVLLFSGNLVVAGFGTYRQNVETDNPAGVTA